MGKMKTFFLAFVALDAASTWKGRSASLPPGMDLETMSKQMCNMYMYMILSNENPTEYPAMAGPGESSGDISYSSSGGSCTIEEGSSPSSNGPPPSYGPPSSNGPPPSYGPPSYGATTIQNCDCSDPKKYVFADKALCKKLPPIPANDKGTQKLKDLTCGSLFNFLSVGLMIFCTLLKL